jgi:RNA polymerase sigma factor (sigma-70 family)
MIPAATREAQADACLQAAEKHHTLLLQVARHLAGNAEDGMELFQQNLLNCHDAIRRNPNGFTGDRYEFYLLASLKNLHFRKHQRERRHEPLTNEVEPVTMEPAGVELATLAEQMMQEVRERFSPPDRVALRLHIDGHSCQEIAEMIGKKDQSWVWRRIQRMKDTLRETFQQHWDALGE